MAHDHASFKIMHRFVFFIVFFLGIGISTTYAQNLVPNGGFEEFVTIPNSFTPGSTNISSYIKNWLSPTNGTPDYFHTKSNGKNSLPLNIIDSFNAKSGMACIGMGVSQSPILSHPFVNEYIQVNLKNQLIEFHKYHLKYFYRIIDGTNLNFTNLGAYFSSDSIRNYQNEYTYDTNCFNLLNITPQLLNKTSLTRKGEWLIFEDYYKADGTERWLTIGHFGMRGSCILIDQVTPPKTWYAYYTVDNVSVIEIPGIIAPDSACYNETITMQSGFNGPFAWYKNNTLFSTDSIVYVSDTINNWYYLHTPFGNDSLYLIIKPTPYLTAMNDTTVCIGNEIKLTANSNAESLTWYNNDILINPLVNKEGTYKVIAQKNGCKTTDSVNIKAINLPNVFISDLQICTANNQDAIINLPLNYFYYWPQFNDSLFSRTIDTAGCYNFIVNDINNCNSLSKFCVEDICSPKLFVPDAFVPSGVNKTFKPVFSYVNKTQWQVYNRWGQMVFEANNINQEWDGKYNNQPCEAGLYLFTITYEGFDGKEIREKGSITLIR